MLIYFLIFSLLRWHSRMISDVAAMSLTQICQKAGIGSRTTQRAMTALLVVILVTQFAVYQYDNGNQAVVQQNWRGNRRHYVDKLNVSTTENLYGNPVSRIESVEYMCNMDSQIFSSRNWLSVFLRFDIIWIITKLVVAIVVWTIWIVFQKNFICDIMLETYLTILTAIFFPRVILYNFFILAHL